MACSGITAYGALKKIGGVLKHEPIVIIGAGGLGLMCIALLKKMDGAGAVVVDIDPEKRVAANHAGASAVIDGGAPDVIAQIKHATNGGAWGVIDMVGSSNSVQIGVQSLIKGGNLVIVGQFGGDITLPTLFFPQRVMIIQGSYVGSLPEMSELLALVRRSGLPKIPIQARPLAEVNCALEDLRAKKVIGRVVLVPTGKC